MDDPELRVVQIARWDGCSRLRSTDEREYVLSLCWYGPQHTEYNPGKRERPSEGALVTLQRGRGTWKNRWKIIHKQG